MLAGIQVRTSADHDMQYEYTIDLDARLSKLRPVSCSHND